ncbi:hypothetical protein NDR87_33005 [Nocardia sp. CDC159]|uniref:Uncharacterized protein n=1 Tax=Nocardia pulmonis TaxID=2951408 RepID=A0A9X2IZR8_9NOCA|nr:MULTISPECIES: hypothetical protein [Nocardia]MCM6778402.1 hypothetical protein [Nocardia pulmonis]MCM6791202.1 hypothetical protein [Nocardia sp. CDC159]
MKEHGSRKSMEDPGLVLRASLGTAALVLHAAMGVVFQYAENGRLITGLSTDAFARTGSDPHRFDAEGQTLGARLEEDEYDRKYGPLGARDCSTSLRRTSVSGCPKKMPASTVPSSAVGSCPGLAVVAESSNTRADVSRDAYEPSHDRHLVAFSRLK